VDDRARVPVDRRGGPASGGLRRREPNGSGRHQRVC